MGSKGRQNPGLYRTLSHPVPQDEASRRVEDFHDDLYELRVRHGIADLMYVAVVYVDNQQGDPDPVASIAHFGDTRKAPGCAHAAASNYGLRVTGDVPPWLRANQRVMTKTGAFGAIVAVDPTTLRIILKLEGPQVDDGGVYLPKPQLLSPAEWLDLFPVDADGNPEVQQPKAFIKSKDEDQD